MDVFVVRLPPADRQAPSRSRLNVSFAGANEKSKFSENDRFSPGSGLDSRAAKTAYEGVPLQDFFGGVALVGGGRDCLGAGPKRSAHVGAIA
jgi:hypothetical protein